MSIWVIVTKNDIFHKNYLYAYSFAAAKAGRGGVAKAYAINSVTINSTGRVLVFVSE